MKTPLALSCLCALVPALETPKAQSPSSHPPSATPATSTLSRSAGLEWSDGELWGVGDGYKVHFQTRGFEFTPAFGSHASRNYPITVETLSIGRAGTATPLTVAVPRHAGRRVEYDRGGVIERYDVAAEHVEQSFVFGVRPAGHGDLVVRSRLSTDLAVSTDGDGLRFTLPDVGSCTMSGVVGIDARGQRVPGRVHYAAGFVELSLPAAFVDGAALPFVLDPLLAGASVVSGTGGADDRNPAVAYDATNDVFCVVWERIISATDHDVHARFVNRAGVPVGSILAIETTTQLASLPQIADCNARDAFVVVFTRGIDIIGRAVSAATGGLGATATIASAASRTESQSSGCVASSLNTNGVLCVWQKNTAMPVAGKAVQAASVAVDATLTLTVGIVRDIATGVTLSRPRLSKSDRGRNRYAVVFQRTRSNGHFDSAIRVIDGSGSALSSEVTLESFAIGETLPEVDGDGSTWIVSWQENAISITRPQVVTSASLSFDPTSRQLVMNSLLPFPNPPDFHGFLDPRVTWIVDSCLVGFADQSTTGVQAARVRSVDAFACSLCEGDFPVGVSTRVEGPPSGCSVQATGGTGEDVLLVWEQALAGNGDIIARRWRTVDGVVTSLGGGCGRGGTNTATCAFSPNVNFAHRLRDALGLAPTVFILSAGAASFPCGSCNLIPALGGAVSVVTNTDLSGEARLPVSILASSPLIGVPLFTQWATLDLTTPGCSQFSLNLSNALRVVIES